MADALRVGIVGASGYTGAELVRLLAGHPRLELAYLGAREAAGKRLGDIVPSTEGIARLADRVIEPFAPEAAEALRARIDIAFTALPHGASAPAVRALHAAGIRVVDLSADFRLHDLGVYANWYGEHRAPELVPDAVYGLPELHRGALRGATLIAAPGCYPTGAILPLAPLIRAGLIETDGIVIDSKSGVTGAGRAPTPSTHLPEAAEGIRAYKVAGSHRHVPEIEQELSLLAERSVRVVFTPHLAPFSRGILTTAYARAKPGTRAEDCRDAARSLYSEGLCSVLGEGRLPDTLWVRGSSRAIVAYELDERARTVIALSALDNLAKGASAQAIQALNVALGFPDALGLPEVAVFP